MVRCKYFVSQMQPMPTRSYEQPDLIFYDGECGVCHRFVQFVVARDKKQRFQFAPLQGKTFARAIPPLQRSSLPDSVVLLTASGKLLDRSNAAIYVLSRLGWFWRVMAAVLRALPQPLRDRPYDAAARKRQTWAARPAALCPVVPEHLRGRFLP